MKIRAKTTKQVRHQIISKAKAEAEERQHNCCKYCFEPFSVSPSTADHRVAKSLGGSNLSHNIDAACLDCNQLKAAMTAGQFTKLIKNPPPLSPLRLILASSRRRIWLKTHRVCRNIQRVVGIDYAGPLA